MAVKLQLPVKHVPFVYPGGNWSGIYLAARCILHRLEGEGISVPSYAAAGELNSGSMVFSVNRMKAAIGVAQDELKEAALLPFATVGRWCADEEIWRAVWPVANAPFDIDLDIFNDPTEHSKRMAAVNIWLQRKHR